MGTFFLVNRWSEARPPPNHLGLDFHIYMYTYVCTFLIRVRALVICNRNLIATKREEFPAQVVEVASCRLHFASLARLLQLLQQTFLHMPAASMELSIGLLLVTIAKIQVFLVRPDNMPRSTHKCLNIYYPSKKIPIFCMGS